MPINNFESYLEWCTDEIHSRYGYLSDVQQQWQFEYVDRTSEIAERTRFSAALVCVAEALFSQDQADILRDSLKTVLKPR